MGSIVPEQNRFNKHFQGQRTVKLSAVLLMMMKIIKMLLMDGNGIHGNDIVMTLAMTK